MSIEELYNILLNEKPSEKLKNKEQELFKLIPEMEKCKNFNQNNEWHIYDVYEHILHVVDNVSPNIIMRLSAIFHDIGKPNSYKEDENKVGHFYGHWEESQKIFESFAQKHNIEKNISNQISNLIYYHDVNIAKLNDEKLIEMFNKLGQEGIKQLYELKRADLLAQNKKYHYMLEDYEKQKKLVLSKISKNS